MIMLMMNQLMVMPLLNSINKDKNFVIQGRALPFDNDKVPLGYKTTIVGEFKIAIDEADGFLVNKKIFLEDKLLGNTD
jgi:hypothetical protein